MSVPFPFGRPSGGEPTPVLPTILRNDRGQSTAPLTALVDTGADGTLAPLSLLKAAGFRAGRQRRSLQASRADIAPEIVIGYSLTLQIGSLELRRVEVFGSRHLTGVILGRDVLNQLVFTYDGPRRVLELLAPDSLPG